MKIKDDKGDKWLAEALALMPLPADETSRGLVTRAIEFQSPRRLPVSLVNPVRSDFFELATPGWRERRFSASPKKRDPYTDEWLVRRRPAAGLFDIPEKNPLENLEMLEGYRFPLDVLVNKCTEKQPLIDQAFEAGKYIIADDPVNLYERCIDLTGMETLMTAPYHDGASFETLLDSLTDVTVAVIEAFGRTGKVQGFMTWQDFGTQDRLAMDMNTFCRFYRPRIKRMIDAAHSRGMHFIWHCCGAIFDLIPEMIDMGVDVLQLDQPKLLGYNRLAENFGGKLCFWVALDTIWSAEKKRSEDELVEEISKMIDALRRFDGGLMLRHYPQPEDIGLSPAVQEIIAREFL